MDGDSEFNRHGSNAVRDVERAYLSLAQDSDYEKPTYDVTRDRFVPHADRKKKGRPKKSNLDELKRNLENQYRETRDKWKVSDVSDSSDLPVYNVTHDELGQQQDGTPGDPWLIDKFDRIDKDLPEPEPVSDSSSSSLSSESSISSESNSLSSISSISSESTPSSESSISSESSDSSLDLASASSWSEAEIYGGLEP